MITVFSQVDYPYHSDTKTFLNALKSVGTHLDIDKAKSLDGFVRDLHGEYNPNYTTYDIWSKFRALYPFIGGNAEAHKFNLINPVDSDAAYRLTFYGSPTHSNLGTYFFGQGGQYAETHCWIGDLDPSAHLSYYIQQIYKDAPAYGIMGDHYHEYSGLGCNCISYHGGATTTLYNGLFGESDYPNYPTFNLPNYPTIDPQLGLIAVNRLDDTEFGCLLAGNYYTAIYGTGQAPGTIERTIKINQGFQVASAADSTCSLASIGSGVTAEEIIFFNSAVQAYQTGLERRV